MSKFYIKHLEKLGCKEKEMPNFVQREIAANRRHSMIVAQYNAEIAGIGRSRTTHWGKLKGSSSDKKMLDRINA